MSDDEKPCRDYAMRFRVAPLRWRRTVDGGFARWTAHTAFGTYEVLSAAYQTWLTEGPRPASWNFEFDERSRNGFFDCRSVAEGKALAEAHWFDTVTMDLNPADDEAAPSPVPARPAGEESK